LPDRSGLGRTETPTAAAFHERPMNARFADCSGYWWHPAARMETAMTKEFQGPVLVTVKSGMTFEVRSTAEASACLLRYWRRECSDEVYLIAMKTCMKVFAGMAEPAVAREAFVRAAQHAGILAAADLPR
jgi:hypothetical protein